MPRRAVQKITAWSFSRLSTYQTCPAQLKYQAIDKIPIKQNDAMARGSEIHTLAEKLVKDGTVRSKIPEELDLFRDEFKGLINIKKDPAYDIMVEEKWAFTKDWVPCAYFAKNCWVRIVVDLAVLNKKDNILTIVDHKTGKARPNHQDQLKLYGTGGFAKFPGIAKVQAEMWYLDQGFINNEENETKVFLPEDQDKRIKEWAKETKPLLSDTSFAPRPNNLCNWCDYSKSNGGPCKY